MDVDNPVGKLRLDGDYFTGRYSDKLFYYASVGDGGGDLGYLKYERETYLKAKSNLLKLREKYVSKGIDFYFLMPSDKFDMYFDRIKDNPYPANPAFDCFSDLDSIWYIAGKRMLAQSLEDGVKDVYLVNDTHWSRISAEIVGRHIARLIQFQDGQER